MSRFEDNLASVIGGLSRYKLVPVIALEREADAAPLAEALVAGGLPVAEVTFRTDAAEASIRAMAGRGDMQVGAGTVLKPDQAERARDAGASFVVSPGFNPRVVQRCLDLALPIIPGVSNPTDIEMALDFGLTVVKFFPAEAFGGLKTLKGIAAPYGMMRFVPTGGIGPDNVAAYLGFDKVVACGGSWMVKPELYHDGDFSRVKQVTREAMQLIASA